MIRTIFLYLKSIILIPHVLVYFSSQKKEIIKSDIIRMIGSKHKNQLFDLLYLLSFVKEFRNLFYYRIGKINYLLRYVSPLNTLFINVSGKIGKGLIIQHGFSTIITAESIGENCWINQQVTIGYNNSKTKGYGKPIIGNNVRIAAGAKVIGPIVIGDNSTIGANAVITKDVPPNSVIVPSSMRIIWLNGESVNKVF